MVLKDRMSSGGFVSLDLVDGMNDSVITTGLGVTVVIIKVTTSF